MLIASKHAVQGYFESLRSEVAGNGIDVTIVSPGYVQTDLSVNALNGDGTKYGIMDKNTAKGMKPDELAKLICTAIKDKKEDVVVADIKTNLALYLKNLFPSLISYILKKSAKSDSKTS